MKNIILLLPLLSLSILFSNCSKKKDEPTATITQTTSTVSVQPKGSRQVAIHITQAQNNSYDQEFQRCKALGIDVVPLTIPWNQLETDSGFNFSLLDIIQAYYPAQNVKMSLNITPIYAVNRAVPKDLLTLDFSSLLMITRFKTLLDSVHKHLPTVKINNFIFGLEVDLYLGSNTSELTPYKTFYDSANAYSKRVFGATVKVGVETTWGGATGALKNNLIALNEKSDMMVLSYYPNNPDFTVKSPTTVHGDIETIIEAYPTIPVFIVECGYQTSASCSSSEEMQKQFIQEMFKLWDNHINQVNFMGFLWLTDLSDEATNKYVVDYGASGWPNLAGFKGYLQTTGLRTYSATGTDKLGFTQLKTELANRGWY